jgi:hypothetical protein
MARHDLGDRYILAIHRLFERLAPFLQRPETVNIWRESDFDNYRFIVWELYLYAVAIFIQAERFSAASVLINTKFFIEGGSNRNEKMHSFGILHQSLESFEHRNGRLKLNRVSLRAYIIERRSHASGVKFTHLMQADFILFLRDAQICLTTSDYQNWWPDTLVFSSRVSGPFEIFARAESKKYFDQMKILFGIDQKTDFESLFTAFQESRLHVPHNNFSGVNAGSLMNFVKIATQP